MSGTSAYVLENSDHTAVKKMLLLPAHHSGNSSADRERAQSMLAQQLYNTVNTNEGPDCCDMPKHRLSSIDSDFLDEDELLLLIEEHQAAARASASAHFDTAPVLSAVPSMSTEDGATSLGSLMQNNDPEDPDVILMYRTTNAKPPYKYAVLIGKAIATLRISADDTSGVSLKDIYHLIEDNFMYYRRNKAGSQSWRSSVRHNLCCNSAFIKVQTSPGERLAMDAHDSKAQASRWLIAPSHKHSFTPLPGSRLPYNRSPALSDMSSSARPLPLCSPASAPVLSITNSSTMMTSFGHVDSSFAAFASLLNDSATPGHHFSQSSSSAYNTQAPVTAVRSSPHLGTLVFSDQTSRSSFSYHPGVPRAQSLYNLGAVPDLSGRNPSQAGPSNGLTSGQDWMSQQLYHNGSMNGMGGATSMYSPPPFINRSAPVGGANFLSQIENAIRSPPVQDPAQQRIQDTIAFANMLNLMH